MSIVFTTSTNMDERGVRGMTLACTQPATSVLPAKSSSACVTDKSTGALSFIREIIHWLGLGLFLGCALNMNATVTEYKSNKQSWHCVEKECTNGKRIISLAEGSKEGRIPPPAEIVVDGERFSIAVKPDIGKNLLGTTVVATKQIEIKAGQSLAVEKDTVLHECIHAAFGSDFKDLTGKKWSEEQVAYWLTPRLLKIITSNPKLLEYLTQP